MSRADDTCWTIIREAADGEPRARARFAEYYEGVVRAYLGARWKRGLLQQDLDDAVQDVFVECFKEQGALARSDDGRAGGFRAFLYGIARNVARRWETRFARSRARAPEQSVDPEGMPASEDALSRVFDRAWARAIMHEAAARQQEQASAAGDAALRRFELLRLRFQEGLAIRDIARSWDVEAAGLHHEYARARQEFAAALHATVGFHHPGSRAEVERECSTLLALLG